MSDGTLARSYSRSRAAWYSADSPGSSSDSQRSNTFVRLFALVSSTTVSPGETHRWNRPSSCPILSAAYGGWLNRSGGPRRRSDPWPMTLPAQSTRTGAVSCSTPARTCTSLRSDRGCSTTSTRSSTPSHDQTSIPWTRRPTGSASIVNAPFLVAGCGWFVGFSEEPAWIVTAVVQDNDPRG
jgi:hypothetical protein